jgi:hypothetical protein
MGRRAVLGLILLVSGLTGFVQAHPRDNAKEFVGTWTGTWTGGSSGSFEIKLSQDANGKLTGEISPKPEGGEGYTVPLQAVSLSSNKMTLKLTDPAGEAEITLEVTLEGSTLKGSYLVKLKADGNEVDRGTLTASKKA